MSGNFDRNRKKWFHQTKDRLFLFGYYMQKTIMVISNKRPIRWKFILHNLKKLHYDALIELSFVFIGIVGVSKFYCFYKKLVSWFLCRPIMICNPRWTKLDRTSVFLIARIANISIISISSLVPLSNTELFCQHNIA